MAALAEQVALVTGGGSGLGRAIVTRFLEEGARVGVLEISPTKAGALRAEFGNDVVVTTGDATATHWSVLFANSPTSWPPKCGSMALRHQGWERIYGVPRHSVKVTLPMEVRMQTAT